MRFGFIFPGSDPRQAMECAQAVEASGWDGFFVWDAVWGTDPWVTLGACAVRTERVRLGTMITPVSRRRPWNLAAQVSTLDQLSRGRAILSVGLGALDTGFEQFGEVTDRKTRAELLDEGLEIITGLWRGQPYRFSGKHYRLQPSTFPPAPAPVQAPRVPIWVVGAWPRMKSMERALRWDGLLPARMQSDGSFGELTPDDLRAMKAYIDAHRAAAGPFDIIVEGTTPRDQPQRAAAQVRWLAEAGATWWLEALWTTPDIARVRERIKQGPPRVD